jgi:hypothetical protein
VHSWPGDQRYAGRGRSRRGLLRAAAGAAAAYPLAGCDLFDAEPEPVASPDPLAPLLAEALDLAARHEAAQAAYPELAGRLAPVAQAHRQHAAELARVTGAAAPATAGSASPPAAPAADVKATLAALRAAEQRAHKAAAEACQTAPAGRAALLGSIAAARATHLEVTR